MNEIGTYSFQNINLLQVSFNVKSKFRRQKSFVSTLTAQIYSQFTSRVYDLALLRSVHGMQVISYAGACKLLRDIFYSFGSSMVERPIWGSSGVPCASFQGDAAHCETPSPVVAINYE